MSRSVCVVCTCWASEMKDPERCGGGGGVMWWWCCCWASEMKDPKRCGGDGGGDGVQPSEKESIWRLQFWTTVVPNMDLAHISRVKKEINE